jgi:putative ABC transport system permease protein
MDVLTHDLRFAIRSLSRAPGFAAVALLTLALGIGANTAIFSVVHAVLWQPLRFEQSDRLLLLFRARDGARQGSNLSPPNFFDLRARARTLSGVAAFFTGGNTGSFTLTGRGDPLLLTATTVSDGFFDVMGIPAMYGRTLQAGDNRPGQHRVAMLAAPLWRNRFGADPRIVGSSIVLSGQAYTVVGIAPDGMYGEFGQIWVPFVYDAGFLGESRTSAWLKTIARVAPGQSIDAATREIETIGGQLAAEYSGNSGMTARPLHEHMVTNIRTAMLVLLGAAGFVLLIACANVANLVLVRAVRREGEMAIRAALGGSRARLLRQLLTESFVLAAGGALLGLLIAMWGTTLLVRVAPAQMLFLTPQFDARVEPMVLLFTATLTIATGAIVGCLPAWQSTRVDLGRALKQSTRLTRGSAMRGVLVVTEMALAVLLLTGAGLLIRSFAKLQNVDPGFQADRALSFRLSLPDDQYDTVTKRLAFFDALLARLQSSPGVASAAATTFAPMSGREFGTSFVVAGRPEPPLDARPSIQIRVVTPDYFKAMGMPLRRGRVFTDADVQGANPVLLISESAARRFFPNEDPIGQRITIRWRKVAGDVVGIVGDIKELGLGEAAEPILYVAFAQAPIRNAMAVVVRTTTPQAAAQSTIRQAVRAVDPNLAISDFESLGDVVAESVAHSRFYMLLLAVFAGTALVLAAIGIFGVLSHAVAHRTREIGIRLALGAPVQQVRSRVLWDALVLAALGIGIGLVAALQMTQLMATLLFELAPTDPITLTTVVILLLGVALLASYLPARRATRVDPVIALRAE